MAAVNHEVSGKEVCTWNFLFVQGDQTGYWDCHAENCFHEKLLLWNDGHDEDPRGDGPFTEEASYLPRWLELSLSPWEVKLIGTIKQRRKGKMGVPPGKYQKQNWGRFSFQLWPWSFLHGKYVAQKSMEQSPGPQSFAWGCPGLQIHPGGPTLYLWCVVGTWPPYPVIYLWLLIGIQARKLAQFRISDFLRERFPFPPVNQYKQPSLLPFQTCHQDQGEIGKIPRTEQPEEITI